MRKCRIISTTTMYLETVLVNSGKIRWQKLYAEMRNKKTFLEHELFFRDVEDFDLLVDALVVRLKNWIISVFSELWAVEKNFFVITVKIIVVTHLRMNEWMSEWMVVESVKHHFCAWCFGIPMSSGKIVHN